MASVFKFYAPNENNIDALVHEYFWFSKSEFLNDPYDFNAKVLDSFPKLKVKLEQKRYDIDGYSSIVKRFALCSFTQSNCNKHFWSFYADSFRGWCLEFDSKNLVDLVSSGVSSKLYDVEYVDKYPDFDDENTRIVTERKESGERSEPILGLLHDEKGVEKLFSYLLRVKQKETWEVEEEKRLILGNVYLLTHSDLDGGKGYKIPWKHGALKSIIMGSQISDGNKIILEHIAQKLNLKPKIAQPVLNSNRFEIKISDINDTPK